MSDALTLYISRRTTGWESDIWRGEENLGGCTNPTLDGVIKATHEVILKSDPNWAGFNANRSI